MSGSHGSSIFYNGSVTWEYCDLCNLPRFTIRSRSGERWLSHAAVGSGGGQLITQKNVGMLLFLPCFIFAFHPPSMLQHVPSACCCWWCLRVATCYMLPAVCFRCCCFCCCCRPRRRRCCRRRLGVATCYVLPAVCFCCCPMPTVTHDGFVVVKPAAKPCAACPICPARCGQPSRKQNLTISL